jgi:hypothetical protein
MKSAIATALILGTSMAAMAHLGSLTAPKTGETYKVGSTLTVKWTVTQEHGTQDLAYSKDGKTWTTFKTGLARTVGAEPWVIPAEAAGSTVRFRVCQRNGGGGCTDANNTSAPLGDKGGVYTLISGNFTVTPATGVEAAVAFTGASMSLRPETHSVEATFSLAAPERVTLEAFDTQGKRLAVLLNDYKAAGRHSFSIFSHALDVTIPVVLRLQVGNKVIQESMEAH